MLVEVRSLRKVFGGKPPTVAVDGINLCVEPGQIFGLLGPNGAGKTTTISICTTRALPTEGTVRIAGVNVVRDPAAARRLIGVVPQYNTLDRSCTVEENLLFHCLYFGMSRAEARRRTEELLEQFHLTERRKAYPTQLSGGLAQRVQVSRAIAHRPRALFLDEPSAGLDPQSRIAMWDAVKQLRHEGITVVLTTHYMEEADELCDRLAIIDHGQILVEDTPSALKGGLGAEKVYHLHLRDASGCQVVADTVRQMEGVRSSECGGDEVRVLAGGAEGVVAGIVTAAARYGLSDMKITEPTLETVFIRLTGRDLRE